jgi:hypothetical protein
MTCYGNKYGELLNITVPLCVHNLLVNLERRFAKKKKKNLPPSVLYSFQTLEKLQKRLLCPSACTTVRMKQLGSHWTDFSKIL